MVRLYENEAQFLILVLEYVQREMGLNPRDLVRFYESKKRGDVVLREIAVHLEDRGYAPDSVELQDSLKKQIYAKDPGHDLDLVETIVSSLGLEYPRNRFHNGLLEELRKAVLLPDELRKVKETLQQKELRCSCGHRYQDGELATLAVTLDGVQVTCGRCRLPQYVACFKSKDCEDVAVIDRRDIGRLARSKCATHRIVQKDEEGLEDAAAVQEQLNNRINERIRTFQRFAVGAQQPTRTYTARALSRLVSTGGRDASTVAGSSADTPRTTATPATPSRIVPVDMTGDGGDLPTAVRFDEEDE